MVHRPKPEKANSFMDYVQQHERTWGTESYTGKPSLASILNAPVVVFWQVEDKKGRMTITLHDSLEDIEKHFSRMLFVTNLDAPRKRPARIFQDQKRITIRGVKIVFGPAED